MNFFSIEKMLFLVKFIYKKGGLKDEGMEVEKRIKGLLGFLGVKVLDFLKLFLIRKGMKGK